MCKLELCGSERHAIDGGLIVVVVEHHRRLIVGSLDVQLCIRCLVGLYLNGDVVVAKQGLVALFLYLEGVLARLKVVEDEDAVIVVIYLIGLHYGAIFQQVYLGAIDG